MAISAPTDISGCVVWIAADLDVYSDNDPVSTATNDGSGADWTQSGSNRPTYKTAITPTGKPVFRFDGSDDYLIGGDLSALTEGTAFIVIKLDNDPPGGIGTAGLWKIGGDTVNVLFPYTDGVIYDGALANARKTTVDPTLSLSSDFRVYDVVSLSNDWRNYLDGTLLFAQVGSTSFVSSATPWLGGTYNGTGPGPDIWLDGDVAALIIYDSALSDPDREDVEAYLTDRYIVSSPPPASGGTIFQSSIIG